MNKIKNLRAEIEKMLHAYPATRDNDLVLTLKLWVKMHPEKIIKQNNVQMIRLLDILDMPREDNVKRIRAKIQNEENKYLPTSEEVRKKRGIEESKWRAYCKTNNI